MEEELRKMSWEQRGDAEAEMVEGLQVEGKGDQNEARDCHPQLWAGTSIKSRKNNTDMLSGGSGPNSTRGEETGGVQRRKVGAGQGQVANGAGPHRTRSQHAAA